MSVVAELYANLGVAVSKSWRIADGLIKKMSGAVAKLDSTTSRIGNAFTSAFGFTQLKSSLIDFNSTQEDTRNQIAGMLALAKKTDLADQFGAADTALENLRQRAAKLPGTTAEYAAMLSSLAQPIVDAKLSMQDLENITVSTVVASKALGVEASVAARDIDQAIRGQFHSVDVFTGKILGAQGFKGEKGRARFNALSDKKRAETLRDALATKQITQLAEAQGKTLSGTFSTLQDTIQQTLGKVGVPLFRALATAIGDANKFLDAHKQEIDALAKQVGEALATAFGVVRDAISWLIDHSDVVKSALIAIGIVVTALAVQFAGPVLAVTTLATAIVHLVRNMGGVRRAFEKLGHAITSAIMAVVNPIITVGRGIAKFFSEDLPNGIRAGITAAFDWVVEKATWLGSKIRHIPGLSWVLDKVGVPDVSVEPKATIPNVPAAIVPSRNVDPAASSSVTTKQLNVGGITINGATDPEAVASVVDSHLERWLLQTEAAVG